MHQILDRERRNALLVALLVSCVILVVTIGHRLILLYPLRELIEGVQRVEKGDLDFQIPIAGADEIGQLTYSFNRMTETVKEQRNQLVQESITDGLTGLYNQRHFRVLLQQEVDRAERLKSEFSLLMIDLDDFKKHNDTWGHESGNELLLHVSRTIRDHLRDIDVLARYGGDELAAILPGASSEEAQGLIRRVEQAMEGARRAEDSPPPLQNVTLSIGGANFPEDAGTGDELVRKADEALYAAKRAGRACFRWAEKTSGAEIVS
jgi:diguanylate cyclase (GGDEF)-like protein